VKIVLDTNVLIAALIARGVCHQLLEHCALRHTLFTSDFILEETQEKLIEKFGYSTKLAAESKSVLLSRMTIVSPSKLDNPVCRDPDDDNILAAGQWQMRLHHHWRQRLACHQRLRRHKHLQPARFSNERD
jgi:putative PIN family toxin of toxin-antitoxin system